MDSVKAWALRHKVWSALLVLFVIGVIGSAVSGNSSSDQPTTYYDPSTVVASTPAPDDSGDLASWAGEAKDWADSLAATMGSMSTLLQDNTFIISLLSGDSSARAELDSALAPLESCSLDWPSAPNVAKAQNAESAVLVACDHFERAASLLKEGVDTYSSPLISQATDELGQGSTSLQQATAALAG